eukprot:CAMPEP_0117677528 /NCGR_PEP_ID=MMETSP0804-20121206/16793_1 /TAXON_ID=1074897 /ORGANISM="Tetraselmis astigmatica, Strain CCMP880" /LENGTH=308 /DNA_ID=CAMNT_0005486817 /DNA_START=131 /DNA_END=1054 /DNA_ORIENTATION=+
MAFTVSSTAMLARTTPRDQTTSAPRLAALRTPAPAARRATHVCRADPDLAKRLGGKGIQLEGFDENHNAMAGMDFARKLEEKLEGVPSAEDSSTLLAVDGSKASDVLELEFDPEGLLGKPEDGLIARREQAKLAEEEKEAEEEAKAVYEEERQKLLALRAARVVPRDDPAGLAQFFFETELNEMEFECTRCKPEMSEAFFAHLLEEAEKAEDEKIKEQYMALHKATSDYVKFIEANTKALAAPATRLKQILEAKDKKSMILEMVGNNEIDTALMALFQTNINLARSAGQAEAAAFMEKVMMACKKYSC